MKHFQFGFKSTFWKKANIFDWKKSSQKFIILFHLKYMNIFDKRFVAHWKTYLEVVGYSSTVTVFTILALIPQAIRAINKQICNNGMSVNMHAIPHAPVPNNMKTKSMKQKKYIKMILHCMTTIHVLLVYHFDFIMLIWLKIWSKKLYINEIDLHELFCSLNYLVFDEKLPKKLSIVYGRYKIRQYKCHCLPPGPQTLNFTQLASDHRHFWREKKISYEKNRF